MEINNPLDVVNWAYENGTTPIPCQPKTKKAILDICNHKITDKYEYGLFDTPFHVASDERKEWIRKYWDRHIDINDPLTLSTDKLSIALITSPEWNSDKVLCDIDIDDKKFIPDFNVELFKDCPRVYGKNGVKLLFFTECTPFIGNIYDHVPVDTDDKPAHYIDLMFGSKLLNLIYGEHPDSTIENPVYYHIDELKTIPFIEYDNIMEFIKNFVVNNNFHIHLQDDEFKKDIIKQEPKVNKYGKRKPTLQDWSKLRLSDVISFTSDKIKHPVHGSTHDFNVKLDLKNDLWHCFSTGCGHSGGGVIELIAVCEGIIDCHEARPGVFDFIGHNYQINQLRLDKWLKLKKVLQDKYRVDVDEYEIRIRHWYNSCKENKVKA
jgi:hypothetical protein